MIESFTSLKIPVLTYVRQVKVKSGGSAEPIGGGGTLPPEARQYSITPSGVVGCVCDWKCNQQEGRREVERVTYRGSLKVHDNGKSSHEFWRPLADMRSAIYIVEGGKQ